jgi:hypothetical protein
MGLRADQAVDALAKAPQAAVERACVLAAHRASVAGTERSGRTACAYLLLVALPGVAREGHLDRRTGIGGGMGGINAP